MHSEILFERDILYPTDNINDPGSIHIQVYSPDNRAKIPVVIECKTNHSAIKYIGTILRIMQSDIFDRIVIDLKKSADVYIKNNNLDIPEYADYSHVRLNFTDNGIEYLGANL